MPKAVMSFRDVQGQVGKVTAYVAAAANATALDAAIATASNAGPAGFDVLAITPQAIAGTAATYENVEDKAQLVFKAADGSTHRYQIPAPVSSLFLADQETVNSANALITAFTTNAQSAQGSALTTFVGGKRIRRRSKRG